MTSFLRLFCALFLLAAPLGGAMAQDETALGGTEPLLAPAVPALVPGADTPLPAETYILPENIPDILMKEVMDVKKNCEMDALYSTYHDCNCIAVKFLDARLNSDPEEPKNRAYEKVRNECANTPMIAGIVYKSCLSFRQRRDPDGYLSFCTCAANDVARRYTEIPNMNLRYMKKLRKEAYIACGIANRPDYVAR